MRCPGRLAVEPAALAKRLGRWLEPGEPIIDPAALATLGIDYDAVIDRLEQTFGAVRWNAPRPPA